MSFLYDAETRRKARLREYARSHSLRVRILALVAEGKRSLDPDDLRRELGESGTAVIRYHLKVLGSAELLPSQDIG